MTDRAAAEAWLDALEALEPEPLDSGQRKRHLKWEGERLRSLLRTCRSSGISGQGCADVEPQCLRQRQVH